MKRVICMMLGACFLLLSVPGHNVSRPVLWFLPGGGGQGQRFGRGPGGGELQRGNPNGLLRGRGGIRLSGVDRRYALDLTPAASWLVVEEHFAGGGTVDRTSYTVEEGMPEHSVWFLDENGVGEEMTVSFLQPTATVVFS